MGGRFVKITLPKMFGSILQCHHCMGFERMVGLEFSIDLLKDIVNINSAMNIFKDQSQWWQDCIFIQGLPQQDLRCVYSIIHWEKISLLFSI